MQHYYAWIAAVILGAVLFRARAMGNLEFWIYLMVLLGVAWVQRSPLTEAFQTSLADLPGAVTGVLGPAFDDLIKAVKGDGVEEEKLMNSSDYEDDKALLGPDGSRVVDDEGKRDEAKFEAAFENLKKEYTALNKSLLAIKEADKGAYDKIMSGLNKS